MVSSHALLWTTVGILLLSIVVVSLVIGRRPDVRIPAPWSMRKARSMIEAPLEDVMEVIEDYESYPEWAEVSPSR